MIGMNLDADNMSLDQGTIIYRLPRSDMLANRLDNRRLDVGCRHSRHRSGAGLEPRYFSDRLAKTHAAPPWLNFGDMHLLRRGTIPGIVHASGDRLVNEITHLMSVVGALGQSIGIKRVLNHQRRSQLFPGVHP